MKAIIYPTNFLKGKIKAQPSKNYTNRFLYIAGLTEGTTILKNVAYSDDAKSLMRCIQKLGAKIEFLEENTLKITGFGDKPNSINELDVGNAGTVLRFLIGCAIFTKETYFINSYPESLGKRPNEDLLKALQSLGVKYEAKDKGKLPIRIKGINKNDLPEPVKIKVSGKISSQYLSSLLLISPLLDRNVEITVIDELKSKPLIKQTLEVMGKTGIKISHSNNLTKFFIKKGQRYKPGTYTIGGDHPGSAAILSAAAVVNSDIEIEGLFDDEQGEKRIIYALKEMGVNIKWENNTVKLKSNGKLSSIIFDGDKATDGVLALSAASTLAKGKSKFFNVENLRYKECDRISDWGAELKKIGVKFSETQDSFEIIGNTEGYKGGVILDSHNDHRVIMGLTIIGLRCQKPITIENAHHIDKSYPDFFKHIQSLGGKVEIIE